MTLDEIDVLLYQWAEWFNRRVNNGLGYPPKSVYAEPNFVRHSHTGHKVIEITDYDLMMIKIDTAIAKLPFCYREAVRVKYLENGTDETKAKQFSNSLRTFRRFVKTGKEMLLQSFAN